jgi:hypothetical protein
MCSRIALPHPRFPKTYRNKHAVQHFHREPAYPHQTRANYRTAEQHAGTAPSWLTTPVFYLPTLQDLSTKSARDVEKLNIPGGIVFVLFRVSG